MNDIRKNVFIWGRKERLIKHYFFKIKMIDHGCGVYCDYLIVILVILFSILKPFLGKNWLQNIL